MKNYYNTLTKSQKKEQLGMCHLLDASEFKNGVQDLNGKKIVIIGCGAQGLNQGLNLRDSGLDVSYALRESAIIEKRDSFLNAKENGFKVGIYEDLIPNADLVINLTPDKQHTSVVTTILPLMKSGSTLSYSHGFNIVEEGIKIRKDITVIMVAPKSPGSEVRKEFLRGFGVPTLIAVHPENDPTKRGFELAKAYAVAIGGHKAGVLLSSFVAEVKSDLMGEQTILCGVLQSASVLMFDKMVANGINENYASKLIQNGWEVITEELKEGGITQMMSNLTDAQKVEVYNISEELKVILRPLFEKHMNDIMSGSFSNEMMNDWKNNDILLLTWRKASGETAFEKTKSTVEHIPSREFFSNGTLMVAFVKSGVELAFEIMVENGIKEASAYFESLHELPLIANTIARKKLFEMNRIISDTAEYGCYLFDHACRPLLVDYVDGIDPNLIGKTYAFSNINKEALIVVNESIDKHPIELIGRSLRASMTLLSNTSFDKYGK